MRLVTAAVGGSFVTAALLVALSPRGFKPTNDLELAAARGGEDCWKCTTDTITCKLPYYCEQHSQKPGVYIEVVYTGIEPEYCLQVAKGQLGKRGCNSTVPKDCVKASTCTGKTGGKCTGCGPASTEQKPTDCKTSGYRCRGK